MSKFIAPLGVLVGAAVWFLLFVILGVGLGTSFIAGGCALAAFALVAGIAIVDAPLTSAGLLLGIATFVILEVVLSVPLWIDVVSGLGVMGVYSMIAAAVPGADVTGTPPAQESTARPRRFAPARASSRRNGHDREPVGAR
jgi:hypothetical protein